MSTALVVVDREHGRISPSGFGRAEACTMSVKLSAHAKPPTTYSLDGDAAHAILEMCLKEDLEIFELGDIRSVHVKGHDVEVDSALLDGVQIALDFVRTSDLLRGRKIEVEKRLTLPFTAEYLGKPMQGTADISTPDLPVVVVDYKNGFVFVEADAVQLGLYVLARVGELKEPSEEVAGTSVVVQPNAPGVPTRSHEWTWRALHELRERVVHVLQRVTRGDFTYGFGPHCQFCPIAGMCPHLAAMSRDAVLTMLAPTPELVASGEISADKLDEALALAPRIDHWLKQLNATALDYLVHGGTLKHAKLVRKRSNRRWTDATAAEAKLAELGADPFEPKKLVTPAEAERRVPKAKKAALAGLIEKPLGDLTLAAIDDDRERVDVGATLRAALQSSTAAGYLAAASTRKELAK